MLIYWQAVLLSVGRTSGTNCRKGFLNEQMYEKWKIDNQQNWVLVEWSLKDVQRAFVSFTSHVNSFMYGPVQWYCVTSKTTAVLYNMTALLSRYVMHSVYSCAHIKLLSVALAFVNSLCCIHVSAGLYFISFQGTVTFICTVWFSAMGLVKSPVHQCIIAWWRILILSTVLPCVPWGWENLLSVSHNNSAVWRNVYTTWHNLFDFLNTLCLRLCVAHYNYDIHEGILIIFSRCVTKKISN